MFKWIADNAATIITAAALLAVIGIAVGILVRNKKKGRSSCGCGCANCPMSGSCGKKS